MRGDFSFAATACAWALERARRRDGASTSSKAEQPDGLFALTFETVQGFPKQRGIPGGPFGQRSVEVPNFLAHLVKLPPQHGAPLDVA